ncbi:tripartite motif-containing protein 16-like [Mastacembelus armatus]|uniref:tripartite motif-containing protein 16-like n=1 Tax=Mastacembelus armatus TaxID=205130 RepID=UPI000E459CD2|nr:tripartite motif-containing protein 16-like [Mastacembelus armatus]
MAEGTQERGADLDQNHFCCSVCLELLKEPVTIQCGHSYCKSCIESCWDQQEQKGTYSCPQCRETFSPRPVVHRNNLLAEVVEVLKRASSHQTSPSAPLACAGPADVACDFCCGSSRNKATVSCLTCLASYCPAHLEPHYSFLVLKTHQLVSATVPLQEKMCSKHNKLMEVYCQTDKMCICYLCTIDEHRRHCSLSAAAERAKEQKQLIVTQNTVMERLQAREEELDELTEALTDFKCCSQTAVASCDEIFDGLISFIKAKRTLATKLIEGQEKTAVAQAEALQLQLEEEISKLQRRHTDLQQLSHTDDHIHFIKTFQSLSTSCESPDLPPVAVLRPQQSMKTVIGCVSELRDNIESLVGKTWPRIAAEVSTINVVLPPVPKTREEFLRHCYPLTLDENTVNIYLSLSEEYRRVTRGDYKNYYCAHGDRFTTNIKQVLCRQGLSGRCYWEVSASGPGWSVAVSYKGISRTSYESEFGKNNLSWSLECSSSGCTFQHKSQSKAVSEVKPSRVGVYLDYEAGTLSFYSISDTMTLLHREHTTFTESLYPGIGLKDTRSGCYAEIMKIW